MLQKLLAVTAIVTLPAGFAFAASHESDDSSGASMEMEITGDAEAGEQVFRKCQACHMVGEDAQNRVGPTLNGVVGRTAGTLEGFNYSDAMVAKGEEGLVWNPETLAAYLENPRGYVEGTKMSFAGLRKEEERANVIAYLAQYSEDGTMGEGS
ncbi:cytochrome c2 [Roseivivax marinus]|uniref:Cytochrome c2 n=1 Tax=Roseivivax marinus TaxID=1379903 RepID=W4HJC9_9RHOB|nr:cytochrome c family protein [Roseivivax marinus]ETW12246.1 cytochrome c2 [Roseivivax marinus]UMA64734.1 cytochrome c family protein [Roseivivax marinus]